MSDVESGETERQRKLILAGYVLHLVIVPIAMRMPPAVLVPVIYLFAVRRYITIVWLRSHVGWLLVTDGVVVVAGALALGFLAFAGGGINRNPGAMHGLAAWLGIGLGIAIPVWIIYRFVIGFITYGRETKFKRLFP